MRRLVLLLCLAAVCLMPATAAFAQERSCACSDLPNLENQLFLMEYLEMLSRQYDSTDPLNEGYYNAGSDDGFKNILASCGSLFWNSRNLPTAQQITNCTHPDSSGTGSSGAPDQSQSHGASASAATDVNDASCGLKDGANKPTTPKQYRNRPGQDGCKIDNDADLAHEAQHARTCKAAWASGHGKDFANPSFFAADDARSYAVSVKVYRTEIAKLANDCGWEGSTNKMRPDKSKPDKNKPQPQVPVVPTKAQATALANAVKAGGAHK